MSVFRRQDTGTSSNSSEGVGDRLVVTDSDEDEEQREDGKEGDEGSSVEDKMTTRGGGGGNGGGGFDQHTLKLASTVAAKSEVFCLAFSEDGR